VGITLAGMEAKGAEEEVEEAVMMMIIPIVLSRIITLIILVSTPVARKALAINVLRVGYAATGQYAA